MENRLTRLLRLEAPIMLAGMAPTSGPDLVAAVSNAGGIGTLGAASLSPVGLRSAIRSTRELLKPGRPMGVDLLLPKVGSGAKATNKDYTGGAAHDLVTVMIEERIELFVCAVGVPPKEIVDRLHGAGIPVMNMIGSPKHVKNCLAAGVDIICAQGGEGGGHTGSISTMVLLPQVVDACKGTGTLVVAAGGIVDGRGIAAALMLGADGVWLGSRFIVTPEANAPPELKQALVDASSDQTTHTRVYTGRTLRCLSNPFVDEWMTSRHAEMEKLLAGGRVPFENDLRKGKFDDRAFLGWWWGGNGTKFAPSGLADDYLDRHAPLPQSIDRLTLLRQGVTVGQCVGALKKVEPAADVFRGLVAGLQEALRTPLLAAPSRL
mmetsp:Transcript_107153/g.334003  ORF Transcript_107153/g.334003 Transcript_107153/m.334003 type:complete len:377 (+) Transcript_107153:78-1208(+)